MTITLNDLVKKQRDDLRLQQMRDAVNKLERKTAGEEAEKDNELRHKTSGASRRSAGR